ncbi:MAG: RNA-directed DNA polymerase [Myxococcaceae bacterium]|nr:RNA-directed DNA polymerase [Myxococcaceae bacterium]
MTNRIDDHVPAAPPALTNRAPPRKPLTEAERAEREKQRTAAEARWLEIESKGGVDGWVRAKLIEAGHTPDAAAPANEDEKKTFKEKKGAERAERKKLKALANEARRFGTIGYLGNTVHWDELKDADDFDLKDRAQRAEQNGLPPWETANELAAAMELSLSELRWLTFHREVDTGSHYHSWKVPKRTGGERTITAPMPKLKALQRWALEQYFEKLPVHAAAHGFLPARSVLTNALAHVGADVVVKLDVKDFFPTVTWQRVKGLLRKAGVTEPVATLLALLCTEAPRQLVEFREQTLHVATGPRCLPQGAPTSPAITNALCLRMDRRLSALARALGCTYTRYADDLTFSFKKTPERKRLALGILVEKTKDVLKSEGFTLHAKKTQVLRRGAAQRVTGLTINPAGPQVASARVSRDVLRRLRAAIHNRQKGKPYREGESHAHLQGLAAWVYMSDPKKGSKLLEQVAALPRA